MIRCLLTYYSLEFFKEYNQFKWDENDKERKKCIDIINGSVVGSWANKIVPEAYFQAISQTMGMRMNLDMRNIFNVQIDVSKFDLDRDNRIISKNYDAIKDSVSKIIKTILIYGMFFEQPCYKRERANRWRIETEKQLYSGGQNYVAETKDGSREEKTRDNEKKLEELGLLDLRKGKIRICGVGKTNFNVFGFVSNAFQYWEMIFPLIKDICDILFVEEELKRKVEQDFKKEFDDWGKVFKGFALPIYNMDITYNLIKRLRQRNMGKDNVPFENIWKEILEIYKFMYEHLKINDEYYGNICGQNNEIISFSEAFIECPYMKWLFTVSEDGTLKEKDFASTLVENFEDELLNTIISNAIKFGFVPEKPTEEVQGYDD